MFWHITSSVLSLYCRSAFFPESIPTSSPCFSFLTFLNSSVWFSLWWDPRLQRSLIRWELAIFSSCCILSWLTIRNKHFWIELNWIELNMNIFLQNFCKGDENTFLMKVTHDLGEIYAVRISHDNSGEGSKASWYLSKIIVVDEFRQKWYVYPEKANCCCSWWFSSNFIHIMCGTSGIQFVPPPLLYFNNLSCVST